MDQTQPVIIRETTEYPDYGVGNDGIIYRLTHYKGIGLLKNPRPLKPILNKAIGLYFVNLWTQGKQSVVYIHKLVAKVWIGPRPTDHHIHHKDRDRTNNRPENLQYVTQAGHLEEHLRVGDHGNKLTHAKVLAILDSPLNSRELAAVYGVHESTINRARRGCYWAKVYEAWVANKSVTSN